MICYADFFSVLYDGVRSLSDAVYRLKFASHELTRVRLVKRHARSEVVERRREHVAQRDENVSRNFQDEIMKWSST